MYIREFARFTLWVCVCVPLDDYKYIIQESIRKKVCTSRVYAQPDLGWVMMCARARNVGSSDTKTREECDFDFSIYNHLRLSTYSHLSMKMFCTIQPTLVPHHCHTHTHTTHSAKPNMLCAQCAVKYCILQLAEWTYLHNQKGVNAKEKKWSHTRKINLNFHSM